MSLGCCYETVQGDSGLLLVSESIYGPSRSRGCASILFTDTFYLILSEKYLSLIIDVFTRDGHCISHLLEGCSYKQFAVVLF